MRELHELFRAPAVVVVFRARRFEISGYRWVAICVAAWLAAVLLAGGLR